MLSHAAAGPVNHLLRGESWALRRLQPHCGRTVVFDVFPFRLAFTITDRGEVRAALRDAEPDVVCRLSPPLAMRVLAGDEAAMSEVAVSGDGDFAQAIEQVVRNVRWDFEEDLSRVLGDVAAHRVARTGRSLLRWQADALDGMARGLAEYLTDERPTVARREDVAGFVRDVDTLRDDTERLAARIQRLSERRAGSAG